MRSHDFEEFSNVFLLFEGDHAVVRSYGKPETERVKKSHTKSRNGCLACKRRRVKCDERLPCGHCINRQEKCERADPRRQLAKSELRRQPSSSSQHVNTLHIELFHHFEKVTMFTLGFPEIWELLLKVSFTHEYLMHAILSTAAKHLSILRPHDPRYAEAAIVLLNQSIQSFRGTLNTPISAADCEARLGTSILINYMAWSDLGFLEGQNILANPDAGGLDLSGDALFSLASRVRPVFFNAFPIFREHDSPFVQAVRYHPCDNIQEEAVRRGTRWQEITAWFFSLFDDPKYQGSPIRQCSSPNQIDMDLESSPGLSPETNPASSAGASPPAAVWQRSYDKETTAYGQHYLQRVIEHTPDPALALRFKAEGLTDRIIYERITQRLAVLLSFIPEDGSEMEPLSEERLRDIERHFSSFPTLCFGPFLPLIVGNDSRALVVLYHTYRAANRLLRFERAWWAEERARTMERLTLAELKARDLSADIELPASV